MAADPRAVAALGAARSFLFTPASSSRMLEKLAASDADALVVDLEDGVAADRKAQAREAYREHHAALVAAPGVLVLRINGADSPDHDADLELVAALAPDALVIPKATPESLEPLGRLGLPLIAALETAASLVRCERVAAAPGVVALTLGAADLGAELGLEDRADRHQLLFARSLLVLHSAAAGLRQPIDVVHMNVRDEAGLADACEYARALGFGGKACIHPDQVATINERFAPSPDAVAWATRVVAAYDAALEAGQGAISVDGELVDLPVVERARRVLDRDGLRRVRA